MDKHGIFGKTGVMSQYDNFKVFLTCFSVVHFRLLKIRATLDLSGDRCLFHCHLQTPSKFIL
jgi:hypothetical protein